MSDASNCLARDIELTNMIQPKFKRNEKPRFDQYFQYDNIESVVGWVLGRKQLKI
jgi:hypothetical protein